ncbi:MAG: acylphosphatase [Phycisphaerales bacterium]|nr:acylphosphatase [Phycisphaerales bacterium]
MTVIFRGRVQGVFFRATTRALAQDYAVTGWVRNEADGSVRCVVEGDPGEIDRFLDAVREAKRGNITDEEVTPGVATGEFSGFAVR